MNENQKDLLLYIAKCITATALVFLLSQIFHYPNIGWCLVSTVLVLSPDSQQDVSFATIRIKANLIAGSTSLLCLLFGSATLLTICLAYCVTILFCSWFRLMAGGRSALAAVTIIMLHHTEGKLWQSSLERVVSVAVGCVLGLLITFLFHRCFLRFSTGHPVEQVE